MKMGLGNWWAKKSLRIKSSESWSETIQKLISFYQGYRNYLLKKTREAMLNSSGVKHNLRRPYMYPYENLGGYAIPQSHHLPASDK